MARCLHPITIRHPTLKKFCREFYQSHGYSPTFEEEQHFCEVHLIERTMEIPCGKCLYCFERKQEAWRLRLQAEQKDSFSCFFCTLTYAPEFEPKDGVLKTDFQKFMKRFRKDMVIPLRFFAISEYGPKNTHRPHYHFALFFKQFVSSEEVFVSLKRSWSFGFPHVEELTDGRICYISTYCIKFFNEAPVGKNVNFMLCSRKPFIGHGYLTSEVVDIHRRKLLPIIHVNGFKKQMPRIYKEKIFDDNLLLDIREIQKEREVDLFEESKRIANERFASYAEYLEALRYQERLDYRTAWRRYKESKKL